VVGERGVRLGIGLGFQCQPRVTIVVPEMARWGWGTCLFG
jgi:hypothetical protein